MEYFAFILFSFNFLPSDTQLKRLKLTFCQQSVSSLSSLCLSSLGCSRWVWWLALKLTFSVFKASIRHKLMLLSKQENCVMFWSLDGEWGPWQQEVERPDWSQDWRLLALSVMWLWRKKTRQWQQHDKYDTFYNHRSPNTHLILNSKGADVCFSRVYFIF